MELQRDGSGVGTQHDLRHFSAGKFNAFGRGELSHRAGKTVAKIRCGVKLDRAQLLFVICYDPNRPLAIDPGVGRRKRKRLASVFWMRYLRAMALGTHEALEPELEPMHNGSMATPEKTKLARIKGEATRLRNLLKKEAHSLVLSHNDTQVLKRLLQKKEMENRFAGESFQFREGATDRLETVENPLSR
jgi:hypothetical protein